MEPPGPALGRPDGKLRTRWLHPGYQAAARVLPPSTPGRQYLYSVDCRWKCNPMSAC